MRINHARRAQAQHIHKRRHAPAVLQPDRKRRVVRRLHTPSDCAVADFPADQLLLLIASPDVAVELLLHLPKHFVSAACRLIDTVAVECKVRANHLRILGAADLKPVQHVLCLGIKELHALKKGIPVKRLTCVLLNKGDTVFYLLHRIRLHTLISMSNRHCQLIGRNAKILPLDAVSHQTSVAGRIAVYRARADSGIIVLQRDPQLRKGHRADIRRHAVGLRRIGVMHHTVLYHHRTGVHRRHLHRYPDQVWKAVHDLTHHIFIKEHHALSKLLVIANIRICLEHPRHALAHVDDHNAERRVRNPKLRAAHPFCMPVKKVRHHQIIEHPAIAEKCPYIIGLCGKTKQHAPDAKPLCIVVHRIPDTAPLAPSPCFFACVK